MKIILPLLSLCFLSSCQIYTSDFDCPHSPGLGCVSVSHVNDLIDRGHFSQSDFTMKDEIKTRDLKVTFYKGENTVTRSLRVEDR